MFLPSDNYIIGCIKSKLATSFPAHVLKPLYFQILYHLVIVFILNNESVLIVSLTSFKCCVSFIANKIAYNSPLMLLYGGGFNITLLLKFHSF
jgi:hypothetical protein